jgi:choline dehydrogenase-like flavoprotein
MYTACLHPLEEEYDAIVVGTGISGGWAAKELCEKGLKTLVLERGRMIKHIEEIVRQLMKHINTFL